MAAEFNVNIRSVFTIEDTSSLLISGQKFDELDDWEKLGQLDVTT